MGRRAVIVALAALVLPSAAQPQPVPLMPGVTYERQVQFTFHGPVVLHVLTAPRPGGLWWLRPVLSNDAIPGTEPLTAIEKRMSAGSTVAGVNGDRFAADGRPGGVLLRGGALEHPPGPRRSSIGIDSAGTLRVARVSLAGTWEGTGQRRPLETVNDVPSTNGVALYTRAWGPATPLRPGSYEVVLSPFGPALPNTDVRGTVAQVGTPGGGTPIPEDGAVLVARGTNAPRVQAEAPPGARVGVRLVLTPAWPGVVNALGGGPALVRDGKAVFNAGEAFLPSQLGLRQPRSAVGQLRDGRIVLVTADGDSPGYSTGMGNFDLALALVRLGAVTGASLGTGPQAAMAYEGQLLSRPPGGEQPVSEALLLGYDGVQVPLPSEPVLSPNGDGVAENEQLAYKVVRPSRVTATLTGPDGVPRLSNSGDVLPGTVPVTWNGRAATGGPEPEGRWRFTVSAVDDLGRSSTFERTFTLDLTLGFARGAPTPLTVPRRRPRTVATFELTRQATVSTAVETASGARVRTLVKGGPAPAGKLAVTWDGVGDRGGIAGSGRYVARVTATTSVGTVSLTAPFAVRRLGKPLH